MNRLDFDPALRAAMTDPPIATSDLPGMGGAVRQRPEDFVVDEIPAYEADGREERHLLVRIEKRGLPSHEAVALLCEHTGVDRGEAGMAGRKDADAVTRQWISLPWAARESISTLRDPRVRVLDVHPHGQKLRTGHLKANRFSVVVRDLEVDAAPERCHAKLDRLRAGGGLENLYGPQRFGLDGTNLERGFGAIAAPRLDRRFTFVASAAQSGVFNLYVFRRREGGGLRRVLPGDVLRKTESGGMFTTEDPGGDQQRLDAGDLQLTGPMPGAKTRRPPEGTPSAAFEDAILAEVGLDYADLERHGKRLPGSRRSCTVPIDQLGLEISEEPAVAELREGIRLEFTLPAGSFATQLLRELQNGPEDIV
ncbi:MAG TPA: tRNA pseudouridine(13) synthase TruD [Candidatus Krumholzibacteria bacterium]|nr:tRNA pseudouridine(13) synthase TruD [Candidatus Krumholzibacteria bacterium]